MANFSFLSEDGDDDICNDDDDDVPNRAAQKGVVVGACIERLFLALGHSSIIGVLLEPTEPCLC